MTLCALIVERGHPVHLIPHLTPQMARVFLAPRDRETGQVAVRPRPAPEAEPVSAAEEYRRHWLRLGYPEHVVARMWRDAERGRRGR